MVSAEFIFLAGRARSKVKTIFPIPSCRHCGAQPGPAISVDHAFWQHLVVILEFDQAHVEIRGVKGDGLLTTVLPERTAGTMCQIAIRTGKFQGVIEPTTPIGLRHEALDPALIVVLEDLHTKPARVQLPRRRFPSVNRDRLEACPASGCGRALRRFPGDFRGNDMLSWASLDSLNAVVGGSHIVQSFSLF